MVKPRHRGELTGIEVWRIPIGNQGICIRGVAHYQHFDIATGDCIDSGTLFGKNSGICLKQILAFHTGPTRFGTNQQAVICVLKCHRRIVCRYNVGDQRKGAIFDFHYCAFQRL